MQPPPTPQTGKTRGYLVGLVILLCVLLLLSVVINLVLMLTASPVSSFARTSNAAEDEFPKYKEQWSYGRGTTKAVRIQVKGIITRESPQGLLFAQLDKIEEILRQIRTARNDKNVRAIILEVDSPGGGITPSDEIYEALMAFKRSRDDRKIVVFMKDLAASGGYYVAMAGDRIIAQPTSIVGSIGVIIQALNIKGLSEIIGITDTTVKSGKNKDLLNPFREAREEELALLQDMIDSMYDRFFNIVQQARSIDRDKLKEIADGRIYTAVDAQGHGLIDKVGYWDDVVEETQNILDTEEVKIVRYQRQQDLFGLLGQLRTPIRPSMLLELEQPRFLYLWRP